MSLLPLLPIEEGYYALHRGIIHQHPAEQWLGALDHMDTDVSNLRHHIQGLLGDSMLHGRWKEFMVIGDWALARGRPLATWARRAAIRAWTQENHPAVPQEEIESTCDWVIANAAAGNAVGLWNKAGQQCYRTNRITTVGEVMMSHRESQKAIALLDRVATAPDKARARLPWDRYVAFLAPSRTDDGPPTTPNLSIFARLVSLAPPAVWPLFAKTLEKLQHEHAEPDNLARAKSQPWLLPLRWEYSGLLLDRALAVVDLSTLPRLWPSIVSPAGNERMVAQLLAQLPGNQRARLYETLAPSTHALLDRLIGQHDLERNTAPAPMGRKSPRL